MYIYRITLILFGPVAAIWLIWRLLRRQETVGGLRERLGLSAGPGVQRAIWVHGASNGELTAARGFIQNLQAAFPNTPVIVTVNSYTAREMVQNWQLDGLLVRLAPLDYRWCVRRFLKNASPVLLVILENELWPNRMAICAINDIPIAVVGGRLSNFASAVWSRFPGLARGVVQRISYLAPQDSGSADRFRHLGLGDKRIGPVVNLKTQVSLSAANATDLQRLSKVLPHHHTILAASTHEGEEAVVIRAFLDARISIPELKLILAPRHPKRADQVAKLVVSAGLKLVRQNDADAKLADCDVLLVDTLGQMALFYQLACVTFVGGSLVDKAGHTPFEPAQYGSAIVHGPHTSNHQAAYTALDNAGGGKRVTDADALTTAILQLAQPDARNTMIARANQALLHLGKAQGGTATVIQELSTFLRPGAGPKY